MTKQNIILAALLSAGALSGAAVAAKTMIGDHGPMRADTNGDGVVSRSEYLAAAEARFTKRDANGDRQLSGDEMKDRRGRFARQDTNNDGTLSFAEASAGAAARYGKLDANGDGKLTPEEIGPHGRHGGSGDEGGPGPGMGRGPGNPGFLMQRADADHDGRVTRAELRTQIDQLFDHADANKDGAVDQSELQAMRGPGRERGMSRRGMQRQGMDNMPPPPPGE